MFATFLFLIDLGCLLNGRVHRQETAVCCTSAVRDYCHRVPDHGNDPRRSGDTVLGSYATENVERLNRQLGLDRPAPSIRRLVGNMHEFGQSFSLNRPVLEEVLERLNATLILAGTSFVLYSLLGIIVGVISAAIVWVSRQEHHLCRYPHFDPSFFLGMMLILFFSVNLRMFPVSGMWPITGIKHRHADSAPDLACSD